MFSLTGFRNEFLHDHIDHGTCGKCQHIRKDRCHDTCQCNGKYCAHRFHRSGQHAQCEGFAPLVTLTAKGQGDNSSLREILNGNTDSQRQGACHGNRSVTTQHSGKNSTTSRTLGKIVNGHSQHQHSCTVQAALMTLRSLTAHMQMGHQTIDEQQKNNTDQKADHCGKKCKLSHLFTHIHGRYQ